MPSYVGDGLRSSEAAQHDEKQLEGWFILHGPPARARARAAAAVVRLDSGAAATGSCVQGVKTAPAEGYEGRRLTRSMARMQEAEEVGDEASEAEESAVGSGSDGEEGPDEQYAELRECLPGEPAECRLWRAQAFSDVWACVEESIKYAQEEQNRSVFDSIQQWIWGVHACSKQLELYSSSASVAGGEVQMWPVSGEGVNQQLHTGLFFLGGVDASDHARTFKDLAAQLKEAKCHVASLTPSDFLCRAGVSGPLCCLLRQFVGIDADTTDLEILAAWHREPANQAFPLVIMIEAAESSKSSVLADLIVALSEWTGELPIILVMGLATTADSLRKSLPASALERLKPCKFSLRSPADRLEAVVRATLVESFFGFEVGQRVADFMQTHFSTHDLTVSFLLRSLKVACVEHFCREPLSFLCSKLFNAESQAEFEEHCSSLKEVHIQYVMSLSSMQSRNIDVQSGQISSTAIANSLWELRQRKKYWCMALLCLQSAGKQVGYAFIDTFCKALQPSPHQFPDIISKVKGLALPILTSLVDEWKSITGHVKELDDQVSVLRSRILDGDKIPLQEAVPAATLQAGMNRSQLRNMVKQMNTAAKKPVANSAGASAAEFLEHVVGKYLVPVESLPLHEVVCFKGHEFLKQALIGEIRRKVQSDLAHPQARLQCGCCAPTLSHCDTSPDACLGFSLAQEHPDHINVHDWYQSFATVLASSAPAVQASSPPKRKRGRPRKNPVPAPSIPQPMPAVSKAVIQYPSFPFQVFLDVQFLFLLVRVYLNVLKTEQGSRKLLQSFNFWGWCGFLRRSGLTSSSVLPLACEPFGEN